MVLRLIFGLSFAFYFYLSAINSKFPCIFCKSYSFWWNDWESDIFTRNYYFFIWFAINWRGFLWRHDGPFVSWGVIFVRQLTQSEFFETQCRVPEIIVHIFGLFPGDGGKPAGLAKMRRRFFRGPRGSLLYGMNMSHFAMCLEILVQRVRIPLRRQGGNGWKDHFPSDFGGAHRWVPRLHVYLIDIIFGTLREKGISLSRPNREQKGKMKFNGLPSFWPIWIWASGHLVFRVRLKLRNP